MGRPRSTDEDKIQDVANDEGGNNNQSISENGKKDGMTLRKYLTDFSKNRRLDNAIINWHEKKEPKTALKSKSEWAKIIEGFLKQKPDNEITFNQYLVEFAQTYFVKEKKSESITKTKSDWEKVVKKILSQEEPNG
jgi:hypothetical protein